MHEKCGVFGVYCPGADVSRLTFFALFALQHRGQESAGIATADGRHLQLYGDMGLVSQVFDENALSQLTGHIAIGHNRYSTTGSSRKVNVQPLLVGSGNNILALAHNGNIVNSQLLFRELCEAGYIFHTTTDSEIIAHLILSAPATSWEDRLRYAMHRLQGAFSLTILTRDSLYAVRDPWGVRPLCLGKLNGGYVVASESCALDHIGATLIRDVEPGEILKIDANGVESYKEPVTRRALCIFEYIYFARPDSIIDGKLVYPTRLAMGANLAKEYPVDADITMGIPDTATAAGLGYAQQSGIRYTEGLMKNRYVGRTFINPDQRIRDLGVKLKFNPMKQIIDGKRLAVVDDSIVRGTTTPKVVNLLRKSGAKEIHMRICTPPIKYPCFFGVDMATRGELIAAHNSVEEIRQFIGADSLGYLSMEGLYDAIGLPKDNFCTACFSGDYPMPVQLEMDKLALENDKVPTADGW
ncbi:MAG: amidophosphoribosyltransferase [Dehalococcoidales bacterium]|nr:amidophosphoribosyltransferase [Dehalococcoidales bacterium]